MLSEIHLILQKKLNNVDFHNNHTERTSEQFQLFNNNNINKTLSEERVISLEEDGRFGNLLLETATLLLIGDIHNLTVQILPQVAAKMSKVFSQLPLPVVDHKRHCVCVYCRAGYESLVI